MLKVYDKDRPGHKNRPNIEPGHLPFYNFMQSSKAYDKDRPGAEAYAKHRARCHWMRTRLKREGQVALQAAVDQKKEDQKEELQKQGANELCGYL